MYSTSVCVITPFFHMIKCALCTLWRRFVLLFCSLDYNNLSIRFYVHMPCARLCLGVYTDIPMYLKVLHIHADTRRVLVNHASLVQTWTYPVHTHAQNLKRTLQRATHRLRSFSLHLPSTYQIHQIFSNKLTDSGGMDKLTSEQIDRRPCTTIMRRHFLATGVIMSQYVVTTGVRIRWDVTS